MNRFEHAQALAKTAFGLMAERSVPPTPEHFELFYAYAAGLDPAITRILGDMLSARRAFTQEVLDDLRQRFFPKAKMDEAVNSVGDGVSEALSSMLAKIEEAGRNTQDYGRTLSAASGELRGQTTAGGVVKVVEALRGATEAMESRTRSLESELTQSSREVHDLRRKLDDARKESLTDPLTGMANRKAFDVGLDRAISEAHDGETVSLLMCDIDRFKAFNDNFGHQTGDSVLRLVAACLCDNVKGRDTAARYGGEEFAVVLRGAGLQTALTIAEQIRQAVQSRKLIKKSTGDVLGTITISIGVAELRAGEAAATLIQRADESLYAAKAGGRNCVRALGAQTSAAA